MDILVTGGAGFIGSALCERLVADGHRVACLDNFVTGSRDNLVDLIGEQRFELVERDVVIPLERRSFDRIYNLACPASPVKYQDDPVKTIQTSFLGMHNMLELARATGARVLQASTSEVYGDPLEHPQREEYWGNVNPIGVRSCYDEGKRAAETLCFDFHRQYGVDIRVVRIFNTYGPRMLLDDGRVVSSFIAKALVGEPLQVFGEGDQTRSFCFVNDMVEGLVRMMEQSEHLGPINLGNPAELSILGLAELVIELTGSSSRIDFAPLPADDPTRRRPDITRARSVLGWNPEVELEDGLHKTVEYIRGVLEKVGSA